jgi:hypothetical protein
MATPMRCDGLFYLSLTLMLTACNPTTSDLPDAPTSGEDVIVNAQDYQQFDMNTKRTVQEILDSYIAQIESDFAELGRSLETLNLVTDELLKTPFEATLSAVQEAWTTAHTLFEQTAVQRYFHTRITSEQNSLSLLQLDYQMNQWPVLAGYIDSVEGYPGSGIVNDISIDISAETLRQQHGLFDASEATLGFHVIEYLLWGQPDTSSRRLASDFETIDTLTAEQQENGLEIPQLDNNRRRQMLRLTTSLLLQDYQSSLALWQPALARLESATDEISMEAVVNLLLDSTSSMITEEILAKSLYPMLNNEFETSLQSPFSRTSQSAVAAQMRSLESLILENQASDGGTLDKVLITLSADFEGLFYQNLDASKACLILLYSRVGAGDFQGASASIEFETVECINLLTNMVDQFEQIELKLPPLQLAI